MFIAPPAHITRAPEECRVSCGKSNQINQFDNATHVTPSERQH